MKSMMNFVFNASPAGKLYLTAGILTNMHTLLYGSTTSTYFGCLPPFSLEQYMRM